MICRVQMQDGRYLILEEGGPVVSNVVVEFLQPKIVVVERPSVPSPPPKKPPASKGTTSQQQKRILARVSSLFAILSLSPLFTDCRACPPVGPNAPALT
jgi:hypothetical protein